MVREFLLGCLCIANAVLFMLSELLLENKAKRNTFFSSEIYSVDLNIYSLKLNRFTSSEQYLIHTFHQDVFKLMLFRSLNLLT